MILAAHPRLAPWAALFRRFAPALLPLAASPIESGRTQAGNHSDCRDEMNSKAVIHVTNAQVIIQIGNRVFPCRPHQ